MLMRFDPFREVDRMTDQALASLRSRSGLLAIDAFRRGGDVHLLIDLPGVDPDSIDLVVEKNVLSVTAERRPAYGNDDEVVVAERPAGPFTRQLFLGEGLDADRVAARYADGVLAVVIPVAEQARPRRVSIAKSQEATAVETGASSAQSTVSSAAGAVV